MNQLIKQFWPKGLLSDPRDLKSAYLRLDQDRGVLSSNPFESLSQLFIQCATYTCIHDVPISCCHSVSFNQWISLPLVWRMTFLECLVNSSW